MPVDPSIILSDDHADLVSSFQSFVRRELVPLATEITDTGSPPPAELRSYVRKRSAALGFYAGEYPQEWGGAGTPLTAVVLLHHAAGGSGCALAPYALGGSDGPSPLLRHGTPDQVERYLVPLVRGETTRCLALTEPHAGSDAFRLTTVATRTVDGWVIEGRKTFVSNADRADIAIVVAATDLGEGPTAGASAFVVPMDCPGLRIGQRYEGMSGEPLFELLLERVEVPPDAVIGGDEGVGAAAALAMDNLSWGRLIVAAQSNGIADHALRLGVEYARSRTVFGERIGGFQHIQEHLVTSRAEVEGSKLLTLACARLVDGGAAVPENAALAKLTATQTAVRVVDRALQIHGATGWIRGHPLEFLYRHVRMMTIIEGTTEIQKVIVAKAMGLE
ncbi:acyl-CoA dehydrogenase family protein [Streptomyces sp. WMMC500]|uniref:acyl-CoA dehydrogenase family protein n=1 Tax=Streptomyces sp. WMMC500 TaxID=3015154 RepID=UPI00248CA3BE|nr:acyl-CoA dehydrogenase family protein [Streptomyces sp. WMMC500]WBB62059.1 acyl-CoA dehydrogenase family protein [Streptomyces sp. WMMC500]